MENEITKPSKLLNENGELIQKGWAKRALLVRNMENVNAGKFRIKDWDCYEIWNEEFAITLIISDVGYFGMASISFMNFKKQEKFEWAVIKLFTKGSLNMPETSAKGDLVFKKKDKINMSFKLQGDNRILSFNYPKFMKGKGIKGEIILYQDPKKESLLNAIPFKKKTKIKKKTRFVFAHKIIGMPAKGKIQFGNDEYEFNEENRSLGLLDWSRGVFPYKTRWFWSSGAGYKNNTIFSFTLGYGFGDATVASKNGIVYGNKAHKLDKVTFHYDKKNLRKPWKITSNDGRFELNLNPTYSKKGTLNLVIIKTGGSVTFGIFTGKVILDNGEEIQITKDDRIFGFAEAFKHRW